MGYDLTWVDDPYEDQRRAVLEAVMSTLAPEMLRDFDAVGRYMSATYRAMEAIGGYFRCANVTMGAFVAEMEAQGMLKDVAAIGEKLLRTGEPITPDEIDRAFAGLDHWPVTPTSQIPEVAPSELDRVMVSASLEDEGVEGFSAAEQLMRIHPLGWAREWVRWLVFFYEAQGHGGIVVG
jgi:hypothetical protein